MKARDGDAQVKKDDGWKTRNQGKSGPTSRVCPSCKTEVKAKAGFRFASLKCPGCGNLMGQR